MASATTRLVGQLVLLATTAVAWSQQPAPVADPWLPPPPVSGSRGRHGLPDQAVSFTTPVWASDETSLTAQAGLRSDILPGADVVSPEQLWNLALGLTGTHSFGVCSAGAGVSFCRKGDRLLEPTAQVNADLKAFVRVPASQTDAWTVSVAYAPLGDALLPKPSVSYTWTPSPRFAADLGVPIPLVYTPASTARDGRDHIDLGSTLSVTGQFRFNW